MDILDENFMALLPENAARVKVLQGDLRLAKLQIQKSRVALALAALFSGLQLIMYAESNSVVRDRLFSVLLLQPFVLIMLAVFTWRLPKIALIAGIGVFVLGNVWSALVADLQFSSYLFSLIILFYLARGVKAAFDYEISKKELENLGVKI